TDHTVVSSTGTSRRVSCSSPKDFQFASSSPGSRITIFAKSHGKNGLKSATRSSEKVSGVIEAMVRARRDICSNRVVRTCESTAASEVTCGNGCARADSGLKPNSATLMADSLLRQPDNGPAAAREQPQKEDFLSPMLKGRCDTTFEETTNHPFRRRGATCAATSLPRA